jgi:hypothetical protein
MKRIAAPVLLGLLMGTHPSAALAADPAPPRVLNIVVLDTSGSMATDERLTTAIAEIKQKARQLPPAAETPWVVIPFHSTAYDVRTFTKGAGELEAYLDKRTADGGTSIASGLKAAIEAVGKFKGATHAAVLLYTDGEDGNAAALQVQEERLAKLFDERSDRGLGQTLICRRWGTANARLVAFFEDKKNVHVIDAGQARLLSLVLQPQLECLGARWVQAAGGALELRLRASVGGPPEAAGHRLSPLHFCCTTPGADGSAAVDVALGQPQEFSVRLKVPRRPLPATVQVDFEVSAPTVEQAGDVLVLPTLARHRLSATAKVPPLVLKGLITARLSQRQPAEWSEPLAWKGRVPLTVELEVRSDPGLGGEDRIPFRLSAEGGAVVEGEPRLTVAGPGRYTRELVLAVPFDHPGEKARPAVVAIGVEAESVPADLLLDPDKLRTQLEVAPPPRKATTVSASVTRVGPARWVSLVDGTAAFEATVGVRVDGPLGGNSQLVLVAPPGVRSLRISPDVIRSGEQVVNLALVAEMEPAPRSATLAFAIKPPPAQGAVEIRAAGPLTLRVAGPAPVRLAWAQGGPVRETLEGTLREDGRTGQLSVRPVLLGLTERSAGHGLAVLPRAAAGLQLAGGSPVPLDRPATLEMTFATEAAERPFFRDVVVEGWVWCQPVPDCPRLVPVRQKVTLCREAPFKKVLFVGALVVFGFLVLYIPLRFFWKTLSPNR